MIDLEVVNRRLRKLDRLVRRLRAFGQMEADEFAADSIAPAACERLLFERFARQVVELLSEEGGAEGESGPRIAH